MGILGLYLWAGEVLSWGWWLSLLEGMGDCFGNCFILTGVRLLFNLLFCRGLWGVLWEIVGEGWRIVFAYIEKLLYLCELIARNGIDEIRKRYLAR